MGVRILTFLVTLPAAELSKQLADDFDRLGAKGQTQWKHFTLTLYLRSHYDRPALLVRQELFQEPAETVRAVSGILIFPVKKFGLLARSDFQAEKYRLSVIVGYDKQGR